MDETVTITRDELFNAIDEYNTILSLAGLSLKKDYLHGLHSPHQYVHYGWLDMVHEDLQRVEYLARLNAWDSLIDDEAGITLSDGEREQLEYIAYNAMS